MHYHAEVWISEIGNVDKQIELAMKPYRENWDEEADTNDGFWDWWQIGGRWTGAHYPDYDPYGDERNVENCRTCDSTGFRNDKLGNEARLETPSYTCNSCGEYDREERKWGHNKWGPGKRIVWPTGFARYFGDVIPVSDIGDEFTCETLIVDGNSYSKEEWNGDEWLKTDFDGNVSKRLQELGVKEGHLVTVDYHS